MSATTTERLPVPCCQADTAPMSSPAVPLSPFTVWPVFASAHSWPNSGSFGAEGSASACSSRLGST